MKKGQSTGISAALASAFFLGLAPVLGKQAIIFGFSPMAVVALRTGLAATLLFLIILFYNKSYLYIYSVGLAGCILAGVINGLGSLLYYMALARLSASVGQLLYSLYPLFVALWLLLDGQFPTRLTVFRILLASIAVLLLTNTPGSHTDLIGVLLMLGAAFLYAMHLPINQRVLYEAPAPTVTLYTLIAMSVVVIPAFLLFDRIIPSTSINWWPVMGLTLVTFLSRLALFMGIKHIGGMQTALLGLGELLITITLSHIWLHERLVFSQWIGAMTLGISLLLVRYEKTPRERRRGKEGWLNWLRPAEVPPDVPWTPHE